MDERAVVFFLPRKSFFAFHLGKKSIVFIL